MIKQITTQHSDTDDTDEDVVVGGLGYYSHGYMCLQHQHWVRQVISAGGFNVHCTQAAESAHKIVMHLASHRVQHRDTNRTQENMLHYLCHYVTFSTLDHICKGTQTKRKPPVPAGGLHLTLANPRLNFTGRWRTDFIHRHVRVQGIELGELICAKLGLPTSIDNLRRLQGAQINIGQKYTRTDNIVFWATADRRDVFMFKGTLRGDALCAEATCFVHLNGLKSCYPSASVDDCAEYVLVRWFEPHPDSWERDSCSRPVCPGPLHINNCLWQYAKKTTPRPGLSLIDAERYAYYGLLLLDSIESTVHMCPLFEPNTSTTDPQLWLQTVTML